MVVPLRGERRLDEVRGGARALRTAAGAASVVYPFWLDRDNGRVYARGLLHDLAEDPATGSAAGALTAYLHRHLGLTEVEIHQGEHVDRPSVLHGTVEGERVRVGGGVVPVAEGVVHLPEDGRMR
jgi:predicted PhzF superfamily epimerase YddE/YHI9